MQGKDEINGHGSLCAAFFFFQTHPANLEQKGNRCHLMISKINIWNIYIWKSMLISPISSFISCFWLFWYVPLAVDWYSENKRQISEGVLLSNKTWLQRKKKIIRRCEMKDPHVSLYMVATRREPCQKSPCSPLMSYTHFDCF